MIVNIVIITTITIIVFFIIISSISSTTFDASALPVRAAVLQSLRARD